MTAVNESVAFPLSLAGIVVGIAVMLYGVSLNAGQALNTPMLAGSVAVLVSFAALALAVAGLDEGTGGHAE